MDAEELDYRARTLSGCIPPRSVSRLLELGHADIVEREAGRGEWFCSLAWARRLSEQGRQAEALEALAPYTATGWWKATEGVAELLEDWGRVDEAVEAVRPFAEAEQRLALDFLARLLARHDRGREALDAIRPHIEDWFLAKTFVAVAETAGMEEEAAELLSACIEAEHRHCDDPACKRRNIKPSNAIGLLAGIRERQGRIDEAVALLRTRYITSVNGRDQLAELFARHNRIDDLRSYAAQEYHGDAARRLAELLEERGDVEGAITVYQNPGDSIPRQFNGPALQAALLMRHGRGDEAVEVVRALADSPGGKEDWILHTLCNLYRELGRAEDGLTYLETLNTSGGELEWEYFQLQLPLMGACGRLDEAIERARAHPEGHSWYAAWTIAELLSEAGRIEDAIAVLEEHQSKNTALLAGFLMEAGRVEDAVAVLQRPRPRLTAAAGGSWTSSPSPAAPS